VFKELIFQLVTLLKLFRSHLRIGVEEACKVALRNADSCVHYLHGHFAVCGSRGWKANMREGRQEGQGGVTFDSNR
jgi:hypothetical protein